MSQPTSLAKQGENTPLKSSDFQFVPVNDANLTVPIGAVFKDYGNRESDLIISAVQPVHSRLQLTQRDQNGQVVAVINDHHPDKQSSPFYRLRRDEDGLYIAASNLRRGAFLEKLRAHDFKSRWKTTPWKNTMQIDSIDVDGKFVVAFEHGNNTIGIYDKQTGSLVKNLKIGKQAWYYDFSHVFTHVLRGNDCIMGISYDGKNITYWFDSGDSKTMETGYREKAKIRGVDVDREREKLFLGFDDGIYLQDKNGSQVIRFPDEYRVSGLNYDQIAQCLLVSFGSFGGPTGIGLIDARIFGESKNHYSAQKLIKGKRELHPQYTR